MASRQTTPSSAQPTRQIPPSRIANVRAGIQQLFSGRSRVGAGDSASESSKTPRVVLGLNNLSSSRLAVHHLSRSRPSSPPPQRPGGPTPIPSLNFNIAQQRSESPNMATVPPRAHHHPTRGFVDPADRHLAEMASLGRQRKKKTQGKERPCAPKVKSKKVRARILQTFVSGLFLILSLITYLALTLTHQDNSRPYHVVMITLILITALLFINPLISLCKMIARPPVEPDIEQQLPSRAPRGTYAYPRTPVRVALARDEEAAGIQSEATRRPPPSYGLWKESVRVDPGRIFWQRNKAAAPERQRSRTGGRSQNVSRPPSYISEDGVTYVIEAQPRSIAPVNDAPLPPHPPERGRLPGA